MPNRCTYLGSRLLVKEREKYLRRSPVTSQSQHIRMQVASTSGLEAPWLVDKAAMYLLSLASSA